MLSFAIEAHLYQERAAARMVRDPHMALFADPGAGKTATALEAFRRLREAGEVERALVVAPLRVATSTWPEEPLEWAEFRDLRIQVLHGAAKDESALERDADIYVVNPEGLAWLIGHRPGTKDPKTGKTKRGRFKWGPWAKWRQRPDMLVVDESTKFKNPDSERWRILRRALDHFARRYIMTGTPSPNGLENDIWGQMYVVDRGESLGETQGEFRGRYCAPIPNDRGYHDWVLRTGAEQMIYRALRPRVLRLESADLVGLPDLVVTPVRVRLPERARWLYQELRDELALELETGDVLARNAGALTSKCRQLANGAIYVEDDLGNRVGAEHVHTAKLDALEDLLEERGGKPTLVAYEFRSDLEAIKRRLGDPPHIGGGVSAARGKELVAAWNRRELPVLLIHPASAGHGLNMQKGGNAMVWYSLPYDLELYDQAVGRIYRQGQRHERVFVYTIQARGTIDETVAETLRRKSRTQADLLAALREDLK